MPPKTIKEEEGLLHTVVIWPQKIKRDDKRSNAFFSFESPLYSLSNVKKRVIRSRMMFLLQFFLPELLRINQDGLPLRDNVNRFLEEKKAANPRGDSRKTIDFHIKSENCTTTMSR